MPSTKRKATRRNPPRAAKKVARRDSDAAEFPHATDNEKSDNEKASLPSDEKKEAPSNNDETILAIDKKATLTIDKTAPHNVEDKVARAIDEKPPCDGDKTTDPSDLGTLQVFPAEIICKILLEHSRVGTVIKFAAVNQAAKATVRDLIGFDTSNNPLSVFMNKLGSVCTDEELWRRQSNFWGPFRHTTWDRIEKPYATFWNVFRKLVVKWSMTNVLNAGKPTGNCHKCGKEARCICSLTGERWCPWCGFFGAYRHGYYNIGAWNDIWAGGPWAILLKLTLSPGQSEMEDVIR